MDPDAPDQRGGILWSQTPGHLTPDNAVLVVEVSDSTIAFDQAVKAEAYARSGIAEYWIVNLRNRTLEVRRDPEAIGVNRFGYPSLFVRSAGDTVHPLACPDLEIRIHDLLPDPA